MTERHLELVKVIIQAVLALVVIAAMTWIILSPVTDEVTKGALVVISGTTGFLFGKHT
ncbi:MAG TPA: hypothetical protein VGJ60_20430 [Chloroflexota bacterium]